ncbi:protein of unknown function [Candidatus Nitrosocosmicus franklandus]|uniref:Uncharacterized protein n=1 Tax=Candidatus Nitrosocosmicus franklandianus TaxID=1798806 RepID=A0A484IBY3_9ARCH|nr:protein of unknown function [Candidatus Nitrosocosmicus franklandus]
MNVNGIIEIYFFGKVLSALFCRLDKKFAFMILKNTNNQKLNLKQAMKNNHILKCSFNKLSIHFSLKMYYNVFTIDKIS